MIGRRFGGPGMHGVGGIPLVALGGNVSKEPYTRTVLNTGPIAYWPLYETAGVTAVCLVNTLQNGTYLRNVTVMGTGTGIGDGSTAPVFDGTNDAVNIYSATFNAAFNGQALTVAGWAKVTNAAVWNDATARYCIGLRVNATNRLLIATDGAGSLIFNYIANGVTEAVSVAMTTTDWFHWTMTASLVAGVDGEMKVYIAGVQQGATQTTLGTWAGALDAIRTMIGSLNTTPGNPWKGQLAHVAAWSSALPVSTILKLASKP